MCSATRRAAASASLAAISFTRLLKGSVVTGGLEYDLVLSNGVVEYHGINILKASDGAYVYLRTCGVAPSATAEARVIPMFDAATSGSASFLNSGKFVATRVLSGTGGTGTLQLDVYDVSKVTAGGASVTITKPSGVPGPSKRTTWRSAGSSPRREVSFCACAASSAKHSTAPESDRM